MKIRPDPDIVKIYPQVIEAAKQYLTNEDRLNDIRQYINVLKNTEFSFTEDMSEVSYILFEYFLCARFEK